MLTVDEEKDRARIKALMSSVQNWKENGRWRGGKLTYDDVALLLNTIKKLETGLRFGIAAMGYPLTLLP